MMLRNKKTGGIGKIVAYDSYKGIFAVDCDGKKECYYTLAELNADWEDYTPAGPLIKDEKIRKAVRAWADANGINPERHYEADIRFDLTEHRLKWIATSIEFNSITGLLNLKDGKSYTIAELCGEEEE